ncbi:MAG: hypothetical protein WC303_00495 [Candidatus Paceibacterota bacterium]
MGFLLIIDFILDEELSKINVIKLKLKKARVDNIISMSSVR